MVTTDRTVGPKWEQHTARREMLNEDPEIVYGIVTLSCAETRFGANRVVTTMITAAPA